ncbi:probable 2-oxoglutarate-dependent dioxygenase AOP1 isoform X2 [Macadamia integrifolia]|uniref:probable 2-oxoglutarate-dependent dioxygenase AOP1 isoform X2 n=1 Tax=Macadamia integrifolia TaxID=60698 RepID=UPI001C4FC953|nr:probable 2-oxoglutarate-dependent dioxygenase AOP1 isoform X2 [Macadamia integrifolia]
MSFDSCKEEVQIPYIDLPKELVESKQGNEEWKELCRKMREAGEEYGCFMVVGYDGVPTELREEMFMAMKDLFDLPIETKKKNSNPQQYRGYIGNSELVPLYEGLGIDNAPCPDAAQAFTQLMWPHGNPAFCRIMNSMSRKMHELELLLRRMILESYGMPTYFDALAEVTHPIFRMIKYKSPPASDEAGLGLVAHTDKSFLTILCQDQVKGFELLTKQGHWLQFSPVQGSFLVVVGEMFKVWSNGRLHAAEHRVVMRGDKERYTLALFGSPKDEEVIEVANEMVDEDHPLLYRPFKYMEFVNYFNSNISRNALEVYAGI